MILSVDQCVPIPRSLVPMHGHLRRPINLCRTIIVVPSNPHQSRVRRIPLENWEISIWLNADMLIAT